MFRMRRKLKFKEIFVWGISFPLDTATGKFAIQKVKDQDI
jgi:hypothetical protein